MEHSPSTKAVTPTRRPRRRHVTVAGAVVVCLAVVAVAYWQLGLSGVGEALFYLVVLACPLLHLFMHRGHGHGGQSDRDAD